MFQYTTRQITTVMTLCLGNLAAGISYSIQSPLFPTEAEKKGATPFEYGLVFGIFEIVLGISGLILGKFMSEIGTKFMNTAGLFVSGGSSILFGFLNQMPTKDTFLGFAYVIRVVEAVGFSAFYTSCISIVAQEFPEDSGFIFAVTEAFIGLGILFGPFLGGALYSLLGYALPFIFLGSLLLSISIIAFMWLPISDETDIAADAPLFFSALKVKSILLMMLALCFGAYTMGPIQVGLEPLLRTYNLSQFQIRAVFVIGGIAYVISAPIWGKLTCRHLEPNHAIIHGSILVVIAFFLLAPAPFIPRPDTIWMICLAQIFQGVALGAHFIACFVGAKREATKHGMPDDMRTYGIISGMWIFFLALGKFIGPSITGYLIDVVGFRWATQLVVLMHIAIVVVFISNDCYFNSSNYSYREYLNLK